MTLQHITIMAIGVFGILNTEMGAVGILPALANTYDVSIQTASLTVSVFALAIALAGPVLPMLFARFDRRYTMIGILVLFTVSNIVSAIAPTFEILLIARTIPAFLHPVYISLALASAAEVSSNPKIAMKAVSRILIGVSVGLVLGAPVASALETYVSLAGSFIYFAVITGIALGATLRWIPHYKGQSARREGNQLRILKQKRVWLAIVGVICMNGAVFGVWSYIVAYLEAAWSIPVEWVSVILLVYGILNILGNIIASRYLVTSPNRFLLLQPIALMGAYIILLLTSSWWVLLGCVMGLGIVAGMVASSIQYWVVAEGKKAPELANGLYLTAANLGVFVATPITGAFIGQWGIGAAPWGGIVMAMFCLGLLILKVSIFKQSTSEML